MPFLIAGAGLLSVVLLKPQWLGSQRTIPGLAGGVLLMIGLSAWMPEPDPAVQAQREAEQQSQRARDDAARQALYDRQDAEQRERLAGHATERAAREAREAERVVRLGAERASREAQEAQARAAAEAERQRQARETAERDAARRAREAAARRTGNPNSDRLLAPEGAETVFVWRAGGAMDEAMQLINAGVHRSNPSMLMPLLACAVPNGTEIVVRDGGFLSSTVLVIAGRNAGCRGDVPNEMILRR